MSKAVMMRFGCKSESLPGRDAALNGRGLLREGSQTYIVYIPGNAGPENLRALKGSRGRLACEPESP